MIPASKGTTRPTPALLALGVGLALLVPSSTKAAPCDADALVARALAAYHPKGKRLQSLRASGKLTLHTGQGMMQRQLLEQYLFPGRARLEYGSGPATTVMATDGRRAWSIDQRGPTWSDKGHFVVPERLRDLGRLLAEAKARGGAECLKGADTPLQRVLVSPDGREMVMLDIAPATGLVHRYEGESPGTTGKTDVISVRLTDYQRVEGYWVAFTLDTEVNGELITSTSITSVDVNKALGGPLFERPEGTANGSPLKEL
jgi:hypothetical protein